MSVKVVSKTVQEFHGTRYYKCGEYFQRDGVRLHRVVWQDSTGLRIPSGYHVHHKDGDKANNRPDNLELISAAGHMSHHHKGVPKQLSEAALEAAKKWHGSKQGKDWHYQHYLNNAEKLHKKAEFNCQQCGEGFTAQVNGKNKFCSNSCKSAARRASGIDNVVRKCTVCNTEFMADKYSKKETCKRKCAAVLCVSRRSRKV